MRQSLTPRPRPTRRAAALLVAAALALGVPWAASPAAAQAADPCTTPASFAGGCGTADDPYLISTPEGVDAIRQNLSAHFKLLNDIDLSGLDAPGVGWKSIGYEAGATTLQAFEGDLDGQGHTISGVWGGTVYDETQGLKSAPETQVGLLAYAGTSATIRHLGVTGGDQIDALGAAAGTADAWRHEISATALVMNNDGTITDCWTTGGRDPAIHDQEHFGGAAADGGNTAVLALVNYAGTIAGSHNTSPVSGLVSPGGLVGANAGTITGSYATGDVIAPPGAAFDYLGGLVGANRGQIDASYASGNVIAPESTSTGPIGGLVGRNAGSVTSSYASGNVTRLAAASPTVDGGAGTGGLVGFSSGTISDSYATGRVTGYPHYTQAGDGPAGATGYDRLDGVGGLAGRSEGTISRSYASGLVSGGLHPGGLAGYQGDTSSLTGSFFDIAATGQTNGVGQKYSLTDGSVSLLGADPAGGLRAASLAQSTFADAGWDFATVWTMPACAAWPLLQWQGPPANPGCAVPDLSALIAQFVAQLRDLLSRLLALLPPFSLR